MVIVLVRMGGVRQGSGRRGERRASGDDDLQDILPFEVDVGIGMMRGVVYATAVCRAIVRASASSVVNERPQGSVTYLPLASARISSERSRSVLD